MKALNIFSISIVFLLAISCNQPEGCTDESAINYDITAMSDDGSCNYCDSTLSDYGELTVIIKDENEESIYYNEEIVEVLISQSARVYNFKSCGENECSFTVTIRNLIDHDIENLQFDITVFNSGNQLYFNTNSPLELTANSAPQLWRENEDVQCSSISSATYYFELESIIYVE